MTALLNPYCLLRDVQAEASNTYPDDANDFLVEINKASRWIDQHCRRDFLFHNHASAALTVPASWCAGNVIFLPWPIITLTEITVEGITLPADAYAFENVPGETSGKIYRNADWLARDSYGVGLQAEKVISLPLRIQLTGTFGYRLAETTPTAVPSPDIPADITQACAVIAAVRSGKLKREITVAGGGARETITVRSIPKDTMATLSRYRRGIV